MDEEIAVEVWVSPDRSAIRYRFGSDGPIMESNARVVGEREVIEVPKGWAEMSVDHDAEWFAKEQCRGARTEATGNG